MAANGVFRDELWAGLAARLLGAVAGPARVGVLVVDDDVAYADLLELTLELSDRFAVVGHARNGHQAIEQAAWLQPEVVLMDVQMPVLDGIEATPRVLAAAPKTKVVIVSSSESADDRRRAREAGAVACFGKHAPPQELVGDLERLVFRVVPLTRRPTRPGTAERPSIR